MRVKFTGFVEIGPHVPLNNQTTEAIYQIAAELEGLLEREAEPAIVIDNLSFTVEETKVPSKSEIKRQKVMRGENL